MITQSAGDLNRLIGEANIIARRRSGVYLAMSVAAGVLLLAAIETAVAQARDRSPNDGGLATGVATPPPRR